MKLIAMKIDDAEVARIAAVMQDEKDRGVVVLKISETGSDKKGPFIKGRLCPPDGDPSTEAPVYVLRGYSGPPRKIGTYVKFTIGARI